MSNINVALSTTGFMASSDGDIQKFREMNVPVCIAEMGLGIFGSGMEQLEHQMAESAKSLAKTVSIDSQAGTVFIGEDPSVEDSGLVVFQEGLYSPMAKAFFERWDQSHMLLFEFHVLGLEGKPRYAIRGLWENDGWSNLEIVASPKIHVIS